MAWRYRTGIYLRIYQRSMLSLFPAIFFFFLPATISAFDVHVNPMILFPISTFRFIQNTVLLFSSRFFVRNTE